MYTHTSFLKYNLCKSNVLPLTCRPIVNLIKGHHLTVQVKAAEALEALADYNPGSQKAFLDLDAPKALMRLLKVGAGLKSQKWCILTIYVYIVFLLEYVNFWENQPGIIHTGVHFLYYSVVYYRKTTKKLLGTGVPITNSANEIPQTADSNLSQLERTGMGYRELDGI